MRFKSRLAKAITGLAVTSLLAMQAFAANGDLAGPSDPNKTVQNSVGQTFQYENANSGQGTFTMGTGDSSLTAEWDAIHYAVIFDGTYDLGQTRTMTKHPGSKQLVYMKYDLMNFSNEIRDESGNRVEQYTNIVNQPQDNKSTGDLNYKLRYDSKYTIQKNNDGSGPMFQKVGYELVGWQTKKPANDAEMEAMANYTVVPDFDGTGAARETVGSNGSGVVASTGNQLIADGGQIKNLCYGYTNEYITQKYQVVTLYAIWKSKVVQGNVYYQLQKADGTYSYNVNDTSNVKLANKSYEIYNQASISSTEKQALIATDADGNLTYTPKSTLYTDGGTWNGRTYDGQSRVYQFIPQNYGTVSHETKYFALQAVSQIVEKDKVQSKSFIENTTFVDMGDNVCVDASNSSTQNIIIRVPRKKVTFTIYGMLGTSTSNNEYSFYSGLYRESGEIFGSYSVGQVNGGISYKIKNGQFDKSSSEVNEDPMKNSLNGVYKQSITLYAGSTLNISNILPQNYQSNQYDYNYVGYKLGTGNFNFGTDENNSNASGQYKDVSGINSQNSLQLTGQQTMNNGYILLFFSQKFKENNLGVNWNEMSRDYEDPYALNGGPYSHVYWKAATVNSTDSIGYMQIYLDNSNGKGSTKDYMDIKSVPAGGKLEGHLKIHNNIVDTNKEVVVIRFPNKIQASALQNWLRTQFSVVTYTDPGAYTIANNRISIYIQSDAHEHENTTGVQTGCVGQIGAKGWAEATDFSQNAYLVWDGSQLYWKYLYEDRGSGTTGHGGASAVDRIAHNYNNDKNDWQKGDSTAYYPYGNKTGWVGGGATYTNGSWHTTDTIDVGDGANVMMSYGMDFADWYRSHSHGGGASGQSVRWDVLGGDCSTVGTASIYGQDHGNYLDGFSVNWDWRVRIERRAYIQLHTGSLTTCYTIPKQFPIVIEYDGQTAWGLDSGMTSNIYWSNVPTTNTGRTTNSNNVTDTQINQFGFNPAWINGYHLTNGNTSSEPLSPVQNWKTDLSNNVLQRYGYIWDGHWYILTNGNSNSNKTGYNWLTNRINGRSLGDSADAGSRNTSLLKYNQKFGAITNASSGYNWSGYGDYNGTRFIEQTVTSQQQSKFTKNGYVEFRNPGFSTDRAVKASDSTMNLNYVDLMALWLQDGARYESRNISDAYTGGTRSIPCRVIKLYAARTVPVHYILKYISGGIESWHDNYGNMTRQINYSWDIGAVKDQKINSQEAKYAKYVDVDSQAVDAYADTAYGHYRNIVANLTVNKKNGVLYYCGGIPESQNNPNYTHWYEQEFIYDYPESLAPSEYSRPDNGLNIQEQWLQGYDFIGWTVYQDADGNNDNASYRKNDTKNNEKKTEQQVVNNVNKASGYVKIGTTASNDLRFTSGTAGQILQTTSNESWPQKTNQNLSESNEYFLGNGATVNNLVGTVQTNFKRDHDGEYNEAYREGSQVSLTNLVYGDDFNWVQVPLFPNWRKTVTLTINIDASQNDKTLSSDTFDGYQIGLNSGTLINGHKTSVGLKSNTLTAVNSGDTSQTSTLSGISKTTTSYGKDVLYNNQFYFPISIVKTLRYNTRDIDEIGDWRGKPLNVVSGSQQNDWWSQNGLNSTWRKRVLSNVTDAQGNPIYTYYRFLGFQFQPEKSYPATTGTQLGQQAANISQVRYPTVGMVNTSRNAYARKYVQWNATGYDTQPMHERKYNLSVYDVPYGTATASQDVDNYNKIIDDYYSGRAISHINVGQWYNGNDKSDVYYNTIDCYNDTTIYGIWEPVLTTQVDITRTGYNTVTSGGGYTSRVTGNYDAARNMSNSGIEKKVLYIKESKAGTGVQTTIQIDGVRPLGSNSSYVLDPQNSSNSYWIKSKDYKTTIEYRYNDNFTNEIVNLYKDPIASSKQYQTVLDKLNNSATFTSNQRTKNTVNGDKRVQTPQHYQNWQYYLPLYLGTDEMNKASGGAFIYGPDKVYGVTIFVQRYSFFYANYVPDSKKDAEYPNNETTIIEIDTTLKQASKPSHSTDPSPSPKPGTEPTPTPVPDPGHTPTPTPTPDPSLPKPTTPPHGNEGGNNDAETVLDDLRIHVKLH